jgi:flagellum-specific peptidoglycan hydrolase FlgJ
MTFKDEKGRSYCKIDQLWRKYATLNEAVRDYWDFLGPNQNRGRYLVARTALEAGDATAFVRELKKAGYYTADQTEYTTAINNLVSSVNRRL